MTIKSALKPGKTRRLRTHWFPCLVVFTSVFVLSACFPIISSDAELSLGSGEKWELTNQVLLSKDTVMLLGAEITPFFDEMVSSLAAHGAEAGWEQKSEDEDGNIPFLITVKGVGYDLFNQAFELNALSVDSQDEDQVHFYLSSGRVYAYDALHSRFILKGKQILTSNGNQVNKGTVEWVDHYGPLEATLTTSSNSLGLVLLLLFLGIALVGAVYWFTRPGNPYKAKFLGQVTSDIPTFNPDIQVPSKTVRFCPRCGNPPPAGAGFCPQCGQRFDL